MIRYVFILVSMLLVGCSDPTERLVSLSKDAISKTVMIQVSVQPSTDSARLGIGLGAGVIISKNSHVLSAAHLFTHPRLKAITVCNENDTCVAGELIMLDKEHDLALLKAYFDTPTVFAEVEKQENLRIGQEVVAVGYPLGFEFSVCHGIISSLKMTSFTQSDAMINPGNSGGPVFNSKGKLVGINSFIVPVIPLPINSGIGFSVNPKEIKRFLDKLEGLGHD